MLCEHTHKLNMTNMKDGGLVKAKIRGLVPEKPSPESRVQNKRRSGQKPTEQKVKLFSTYV